jgi:hypothetical protein
MVVMLGSVGSGNGGSDESDANVVWRGWMMDSNIFDW